MSASDKKQNLTARYAYIQGFFWMNFAAVMGFSSIYLLDVGFNNTQIGMIIAVAGTISAVLQPFVASFADRPTSPSLKKIILSIGGLQILVAVMLLLLYGRSVIFTGLLYGAAVTFLQLLNPLINSLGTESMNQGKYVNFGISRGIGSAAYAVVAYVLGIVVEKAGVLSVPVSILLMFGLFFTALVLFPFRKRQTTGDHGAKAPGRGPVAFFKRYPRYGVLLIGCVLVYLSHVLLNNFTFQIVQSKGGDSAQMGLSMAMSALLELPTMFLFVHMIKKVRCDIWFRMSGVFMMLKILGTLLAPSVPVFYGMQIFQMFGWALITVASVYYVNAIMEEQDAIKGQAYITMTYTLGSVLGSLIGGRLIDSAGVNTMLIFGTVAAAVGMVIMLLAAQRTEIDQ